MTSYAPQVSKLHYSGTAYRIQDRWNSYWHQLNLVRHTAAHSVLEVGVGEGVVARELRAQNVVVTTLDIAPDLRPDVIGSITHIPLVDKSVDVALAAEVLEHIRFEDVPQALQELARVARSHVIISLPHPGYVFMLHCKLPLLPRMTAFWQIPFFWKEHTFNGEHYWELGKKGYPISRFAKCAYTAGLELARVEKFSDDPAHRFFLFAVRP